VRRRVVVLCTLVAALLATAGLLGCGGQDEDTTSGSLFLTVYTAGPLHGDGARQAQDGADAVRLALRQAGGMAGPFTVSVVSLDDTDPDTGRWGQNQVISNARRAISDSNIMAYISMGDSGATALSLPLLNEAGVLQIGPTAGYVGLTRTAGRGEPDRFYPSGLRTFGRIAPADDVEAKALLDAMREQGVRRLALVHDGELDALGLVALITRDAPAAGIEVVAEKPVDPHQSDQSGVAADVAASGADAALYAGEGARAGAIVLDALHDADPGLALFASSGLADETFASEVSPGAARRLLLTSPAVPFAELPEGARSFASAFRRAYGRDPVPGAVFGYEAMRSVLAAVRGAGTQGNDRTAVIKSYFALPERSTILGPMAVTPSGDSTLRRYGIWRVRDGRLAFVRETTQGT
jgi:branched-chain amino acid transport system substrate-binding protein